MRTLVLVSALIGLLINSLLPGRYHAELHPRTQSLLAPTPAPVTAGAGIAAVMGLVGAPIDSVFALRGGTSDFWHYSISQNEWTILPDTPAPVGDGSGIVEVYSFTFCQPGHFYIAALRGANTTDFWQFNIEENRWCVGPSMPAPVGSGGAIAQLQRIGKLYVLRGNGTTDFWSLDNGQWKSLARTPSTVNTGGGLVGINYGTRSQRDVLYASQGGGSKAVWKYDVATDSWTHQSEVPVPIGAGGAITSPGRGEEGTLNILQGGGSTAVWSLDIASDSWSLMDNTPSTVDAGGAMSNQVNGCNFTFAGGGSTDFFSTGSYPCKADAPSFALSFDPPTITTTPGTKLKLRLQIIRSGSFTGNVRVQLARKSPKGVKVPEDVGMVTGESASFKIKLKGSVASGTYVLTFMGTDDAGRKSTASQTVVIQ